MSGAKILEASETLSLDTIVTVRTDRRDEFVLDVTAATLAVADLISDYDNEVRNGWTLTHAWIEDQIATLRKNVVKGGEHGVA